jgi:diguanylate cyclase (GGDEF)-like protein
MRHGESWRFIAFAHDISDRRHAEEQMRARAQNVGRVARISRDLSGVTEAHAARPAIAKAAVELAEGDLALLFEPDSKGRELIATAVAGLPSGEVRLPFAGEPSGAVVAFSSGQPFFVADAETHPAVSRRLVSEFGARSAVWQPVMRNAVSIGVIAVVWQEPVAELSDQTLAVLGLLAAEASVALERADLLARLEAVARTDDLTGLANRRAWDEELPRQLARSARENQPLCVAMLDLDRFKEFNDENGHQAGDRLLKEVTASWKETLRPSDLLARYGGEEFILLLPNCPIELGLDVVERLRAQTPTTQTCSAGIAVWDGEEAPERLVARADSALYEAKRAGRDKSIAAS